MPTLTFDKDDLNGEHGKGLEIGVRGFADNPDNALDHPAQVYVEVYEGKLRVHVWDGSSEDPQTVVIEPLTGKGD